MPHSSFNHFKEGFNYKSLSVIHDFNPISNGYHMNPRRFSRYLE